MLGGRFGRAGFRVGAVEMRFTLIDRIGQELVQRADAPPRTAPGAVAMSVEPDAHRSVCPVAFTHEAEDQAHGFGFDQIDGELLLGLRAALFGGDYGRHEMAASGGVSEQGRRSRTHGW